MGHAPTFWRLTVAVVAVSMWFASGAVQAATLTWSVTGGTFADGGTISGTFVQDAADHRPSTWNLNVAGGGGLFPPRSYTPADSSVLMLDWPPNTELTYHFIDTTTLGKRQIRLTPGNPLDGSATSVPLSLLGQGAVECFNCAPFRNITGGSLVLTSVKPTLTLVSIAPDPTTTIATTTATISIDAIAAFGPPTGAVTVYDSVNNPICTILVPANTSCTFVPAVPGGQTLHALYFGDANYQSASSNALSYTVVPAAVTTVTLAPVVPNPTAIGAPTTATVQVDQVVPYPPPTGMVTVFFYGSGDTTLCTITLPATTCMFAPPAGGIQTVGAQYGGDAAYASGYSNTVVMNVAPVPPVVTLVSVAPNPTAVGATTTATATVGTDPVFGPPTGTTTVFDTGGNLLCTITLPATSCTFTPATPGTPTVVARYDGDANYEGKLSNLLPLVVVATHTVTPGAGANGSIAPITPQTVVDGATTTFTVTPNSGYTASVGGTCGGALVGNAYTTNAITADCTVDATFTQITYMVTPSAGANGSIAPNTPQTIAHGATTAFTVTPNSGYSAVVGGTCGGSLVANTYTTNAITANCTVAATFTQITYTVTPSAGPNGSIAPNTPQTIAHGATTAFTVTPNAGYSAVVGGTCGGSLVGNTYTTNAIIANCTVAATFAASAVTTFTGPTATATGNATASFTGGGPTCSFATSQFIPVTGHAASPPTGSAPASVTFPHGLFDFRLTGCTLGSTITMTITYPSPLPAGSAYWKYGPEPGNAAAHWYILPATFGATTAVFSIMDGAQGDDDLAANGTIDDQGGPGSPSGAGAIGIPTLSQWALALLAALLLATAMWGGLRQRARR